MLIHVLNDYQLTKNFKLSEFVCKDGSNTTMLDIEGILLLQVLRDHFEKPVFITSAFRTETHNKACGGSPNSQHLKGKAFDIKVADVHPEDVARVALQVGFNGVGVYTNNGNFFTHVDTRQKRTLWRDQEGSKILLPVNNPHIWR